MKLFFTTVIGGLAVAAVLIAWADPGARWHRAPQWPVQGIQPGQVWKTARENFDDRAIRFAQIQTVPRPEVVVFSSSRGMKIQSAFFPSGTALLNLGVTNIMSEDYAAFWQALANAQKLPRRLLIVVDPWVFNRNISFGNRQNPAYTPVLTNFHRPFFERNSQLWRRTLGIDHVVYWVEQAVELFRMSEVVYAIRGCLQGLKDSTANVVAESDVVDGEKGFRFDGSLAQPVHLSRETVQKRVYDTLSRPKRLPFYHWDDNLQAMDVITQLVDQTQHAGTEVDFILPPYHPQAYRFFLDHRETEAGLVSYRKLSNQLMEKGVHTVCDVVDPETIPCSEDEFDDFHHMLESCVQKVLKKCRSSKR